MSTVKNNKRKFEDEGDQQLYQKLLDQQMNIQNELLNLLQRTESRLKKQQEHYFEQDRSRRELGLLNIMLEASREERKKRNDSLTVLKKIIADHAVYSKFSEDEQEELRQKMFALL